MPRKYEHTYGRINTSQFGANDIANFNAANDKIQLDASVFHSFSAMEKSGEIQQAGPNVTINDHLSTPEQKCVGWPEQKYIGDAGRKAPNWGPFLRASGLGRIIHRGVSTGAA